MRISVRLVAISLWVAVSRSAAPLAGQVTDSLPRDTAPDDFVLPREVSLEVAALYNEPAALRAFGALVITETQQVAGDVAVLGGPLAVSGRVTGRVVVVNGDVRLRPTAEIGGDLVVVGGNISGQEDATIGGQVRWHRPPLYYRRDGERLVADPDPPAGEIVEEDGWLTRWRRRQREPDSKILLIDGGTYNRVEGLPIFVGPSLRGRTAWGQLTLEALGIIRSADNFRWDNRNLGYDLKAEARFGEARSITVGANVFDTVEPVERWHLRDNEISLASFFLRRDYRDYFGRRGVGGYVTFRGWNDADLTLAYSSQRWSARGDRDVFSLFRDADDWRANPHMDEGRFRIVSATLTLDTRNDRDNPWDGWYIVADLERGSSSDVILGPTSSLARSASSVPVAVAYGRGFVDLRRYNRLSPKGQLNVRLVLGGWLAGDPLPLQRRFSVGGPGTLPGFDFRTSPSDTDVWQCSAGAPPSGIPAQCERVALAQVEYRRDLRVSFGGRDQDMDDPDWHFSFDRTGAWVLFADAGRGWLVGPARVGDLQYRGGSFPSFGTFRTNVGVGLDFDIIGVYLAKSLDSGEGANVFIRLAHRF